MKNTGMLLDQHNIWLIANNFSNYSVVYDSFLENEILVFYIQLDKNCMIVPIKNFSMFVK